MRAIRVDHFGGPEVLALVEAELPEAAPGEVLVRVAAAGVRIDARHEVEKGASGPVRPGTGSAARRTSRAGTSPG